MTNRIKFDINGKVYKAPADVIENGPVSLLKRMCNAGLSESESILVNRPTESFAAILAFYQTGELHIPMTLCPGAFMNELEYWEVLPEMLTDCCFNRLQSFLDEQDTLRKFKVHRQRNPSSYGCFENFRAKLWDTLEYNKLSLVGKIYFIATIFMVILSVSLLAFSTDPSFQRKMTNCERLQYMTALDMEGTDVLQHLFELDCTESQLPGNSTNITAIINSSNELTSVNLISTDSDFLFYLFTFVREINGKLKNNENKFADSRAFVSKRIISHDENNLVSTTGGSNTTWLENGTNFEQVSVNLTSVGLQLGNLTSIVPEQFPNSSQKRVTPPSTLLQILHSENKMIKIPNFKRKILILFVLEILTNVYFTIDFILRLLSCPSVKLYFRSVINLTDAVSVLGEYQYLVLFYMYPHLRYGSWIDYLSYIQMFRSLRLCRAMFSVRAGKVLAYTVRENTKDISVLLLFLIAGMCTFATMFYVAENGSTIETIPVAWYWALITMTTVGYGDINPQTNFGRLVACICYRGTAFGSDNTNICKPFPGFISAR